MEHKTAAEFPPDKDDSHLVSSMRDTPEPDRPVTSPVRHRHRQRVLIDIEVLKDSLTLEFLLCLK